MEFVPARTERIDTAPPTEPLHAPNKAGSCQLQNTWIAEDRDEISTLMNDIYVSFVLEYCHFHLCMVTHQSHERHATGISSQITVVPEFRVLGLIKIPELFQSMTCIDYPPSSLIKRMSGVFPAYFRSSLVQSRLSQMVSMLSLLVTRVRPSRTNSKGPFRSK